MKNKVFAVVLGVSLLLPALAAARTVTISGGSSLDCDSGIVTDTLGATTTMDTAICRAGGGPIVGTIAMSWGLLDGQTPQVQGGTVVTDERGKKFMAPWFIPYSYDLTHTFWYRLANGYIDAMGHVLQ